MPDPRARKLHYMPRRGLGMGSKPAGLARLEARVARLESAVASRDRKIEEMKRDMRKKDKAVAGLERENSKLRSAPKSEKPREGQSRRVRRSASTRRTATRQRRTS